MSPTRVTLSVLALMLVAPFAAAAGPGAGMPRRRHRSLMESCASSSSALIPMTPSCAAGVAMKWAALGHHVKMVSVTNGDAGHWNMSPEDLAKRRLAEVRAADKVLGVETEVLPVHDGELEPTLENRKMITRAIRRWNADIVIAHRPWDYHPDHRYVGVLVQDSAYMVAVPMFCPDTPALKKNPVFLYSSDGFQKPYPFKPTVVVGIDEVYDRKVDALHELASQVYEGGATGSAEFVRSVPPADDAAAQGLPAAVGLLPPERPDSRQVPRRSGEVVRAGKGEGFQIRRGVRDLRIREPAVG